MPPFSSLNLFVNPVLENKENLFFKEFSPILNIPEVLVAEGNGVDYHKIGHHILPSNLSSAIIGVFLNNLATLCT